MSESGLQIKWQDCYYLQWLWVQKFLTQHIRTFVVPIPYKSKEVEDQPVRK